MTVAGAVEAFDTAAFRARLLEHLPLVEDVVVTVSSGSVRVTATLIFGADSEATAAAAAASLSSSSLSQLSLSLGVQVLSLATPSVDVAPVGAPPPPCDATSTAASRRRRRLNHGETIGGCEGPQLACTPETTHDGKDVVLFRARPLNTSAERVVFQLQFRPSAMADWTALRWAQLIRTHEARVHLNALSADGGDFYHTHMEATPLDATSIVATLPFLRSGKHLIAATWAVDAGALGLCVDEYVPHAHGVPSTPSSGVTYPLLQTAWLVHIDNDFAPLPPPPPTGWHWPSRLALSCAKVAHPMEGSAAAEGRSGGGVTGGALSYRASYEPLASAACCACANCSRPLCSPLSGCVGLEVRRAVTLEDECTRRNLPQLGERGNDCLATPELEVDLDAVPAGVCMHVHLAARDGPSGVALAGGELSPYLGAAAHLFIVPADPQTWEGSLGSDLSSDLGSRERGAAPGSTAAVHAPTVHAHAYAAVDVAQLRASTDEARLSRALCEDVELGGYFPMPPVPQAFGPGIDALVRLPRPGRWRVHVTFNRGGELITSTFEWRAVAREEGDAAAHKADAGGEWQCDAVAVESPNAVVASAVAASIAAALVAVILGYVVYRRCLPGCAILGYMVSSRTPRGVSSMSSTRSTRQRARRKRAGGAVPVEVTAGVHLTSQSTQYA